MVKQEYKFPFCEKKTLLENLPMAFSPVLLSDKGSVELSKKWYFLAFQRLELGRADNSRMFIFLIAFEDGTSANISFSDPIYIHLHSLFQKKVKQGTWGATAVDMT